MIWASAMLGMPPRYLPSRHPWCKMPVRRRLDVLCGRHPRGKSSVAVRDDLVGSSHVSGLLMRCA
jgi:hypothetical protein